MAEQLIFDVTGDPYSTGSQLDVMAAPYAVTAMSFPAPALDMAMAGSIDTEGDLVAARRHGNRPVSLTVEARGTDAATMETALATLEAKVAKIAQQGGTLRHVTNSGAYRTLDLLAADSYDPTFDMIRESGHVAVCNIGLQAKPYARAALQTLTAHTQGTAPVAPLIFTETTILGDVPALGSLQVTETGGTSNEQWLTWGLQAFTYDAATSLLVAANAGTVFTSPPNNASATATHPTGSVNSTVVKQSAASTGTIGALAIFSIATTLRGTYRVYVRTTNKAPSGTASSTGQPILTLSYAVGPAATSPNVQNDPIPAANTYTSTGWQLADLGLATLTPAGIGTHGATLTVSLAWTGAAIGDTAYFDYVMLVPVDERTGISKTSTMTPGLNVLPQSGYLTVNATGVHNSTDNTNWSAVPFEGDYLTIPAGGPARFIVKAAGWPASLTSTGNTDTGQPVSGTVSYTPRYLSMI